MQTKPVSPFVSVVGVGAMKSDHTPSAASRRNQLLTNGAIIAVGVVLAIGALIWMSLASASAGGRSGLRPAHAATAAAKGSSAAAHAARRGSVDIAAIVAQRRGIDRAPSAAAAPRVLWITC